MTRDGIGLCLVMSKNYVKFATSGGGWTLLLRNVGPNFGWNSSSIAFRDIGSADLSTKMFVKWC
jgi:hypothetical protein